MSNEWRTLKEILGENPITNKAIRVERKDGKDNERGHYLCGVHPIDSKILVVTAGSTPYCPPHFNESWRIYEEPKQPKKWAPALVVRSSGRVEQTMEWYNSKKHAESDYPVTKNVIWPAPGFTPVEIPE